MKRISSMAVVTAKDFVNGKPDKNGLEPIILINLAGKLPNRTVLSGTIAESEGLVPGHTYLIKCTEKDPSPEYGRQFVFQKVKELDAMEILGGIAQLGEAVMIDVYEEQEEQGEEAKQTAKAATEYES